MFDFYFPSSLFSMNNFPIAIFAAGLAVFFKKSVPFYFVIGLLFGPWSLIFLVLSAVFLRSGESPKSAPYDRTSRATPETRGAQTLTARRQVEASQAREGAERERIRGLLQEMRSRESQKRGDSGETSTRLLSAAARALGKEAELEALMKPPASGRKSETSPRSAAQTASSGTRDERAARRASDAEARARSRRESHERRHSKMPASGLSPNDPNFLRGYQPKNNRIP